MVTESKTYNGWSNYETWAVKLWMDNDEGSYHFYREATIESEGDVSDLARRLKDEHESALPDLDGFAGDLLNAAFGEVDWYEIAESLIEDARENGDLDEDEDA